MHPALSVIFFTTLSGAGYGMLMWAGVLFVVEFLAGYSAAPPWLAEFLFVCLVLASILIAAGLVASMLHLGKPGRAWRAFSQWRTSWLSREGVMSLITYVPVGVLLATIGVSLWQPYSLNGLEGPLLLTGAAMTACALLTVICTAMIYASLKTIPAWRHRLVVPAYVAFALLSGASLLAVVSALGGPHESTVRTFAATIAAMALVTGALKIAYWRAIDAQGLPAMRGDAVGLPGREISVFERPHTEESYITREMAFAIARKHSRRLRAIALLLFAVIPFAAAAAAWSITSAAGLAFAIATTLVLAGAFVERWLFFAEARHVVTLYY